MIQRRIISLSEYHRLPPEARTADFYKRLFEVVCNNATLALFIMDEHQQCVYMNPAAETLTGYRLSETKGRALHDVIHHKRPDGRPYPLCECPIDRAFPQNNQEKGEEVFIHKDGSFYPVAYTASPIQEGDKIIGTIIEVRDITLEKRDEQARQALRQEAQAADERIHQILECMSDAFIALDRDWRIIYQNAAAERVNHKSRAEILGKTHWEEWPDSLGTEVEFQYRRAMAEQVPVHFEYYYHAPPHYGIWLEIQAYPSQDGLGIFFRDITPRKQAELMLVEQKRLLELIVTGHPLDECLAAVCASVSSLNSRSRACFLLTDAQGLTFKHSITPDFAPSFGRGLKDAPINQLAIGTCGTAVYCGEPVSCADIAHDDRWSPEWRDLCLAHSILACHSTPIFGIDGHPLGSLMLCFDKARMPTDWEYQLANFGIQIASIVFERDRSLHALCESEERLSLALNKAGMGSWDLDLQTGKTIWSPTHFTLLGYEPVISGEATYEMWQSRIHPDDLEGVLQALEQAQQTRSLYQAEYRIIRADTAEIRWLRAFGRFMEDETGQAVRSIGVFFDASTQKQAEIALSQSEARFRRIFECNMVPMGIWASSGSILHANDALLDLVGYTRQELKAGQVNWQTLTPPEWWSVEERALAEITTKGFVTPFEKEYIHKQGQRIPILIGGAAFHDDPESGIFFAFDLTATKQREAERQRSEARLRLALESAELGTWDFKPLTGELKWDESCKAMFGLLPDAKITWEFAASLIHPDDRERTLAVAKSALNPASGGNYAVEYRVVGMTTDGIERWIAAKGQAYFNQAGEAVRFIGTVLNITERKRSEAERERLLQREQALRASAESAESKLQNLLASIREDFVFFDRDWQIAYLNPQAATSMGIPREAILGRCFWELFPDLVGTEFYERLHQVKREQIPTQFEYHYVTWDIWFDNRVYPTPEGIIVLSTNITERKRTELNEQFLLQLDLRLRQLTDAQTMITETTRSLGQYLKVNCCILGEIDEQQGTITTGQEWRFEVPNAAGTYPLSDFINPAFQSAIASGQSAIVHDVTIDSRTAVISSNYEQFQVRAFASVPCIHQGHWVALLCVTAKTPRVWREDEIALLQEIVAHLWSMIEHTKAVQELRQSEAEFRHLANAMPQIVWVSKADGFLEFVNNRWTEYTGLTLEQSRDRTLMEQVIPNEDNQQLYAAFAQAQATCSPYESQFRLLQSDGSYLYFLTRATPILDGLGHIHKWYGTSTDISDRVQFERDRERILQQEQAAREEAEQANRIKDEFLAVLSHELRSPLNPILGWSKLLQTGNLDTAMTQQALTVIERNAKLQAELIEDLLDVSRILRGKLNLTVIPVNLASSLKAAIETVRLAAEAKSITIEASLSADVGQVLGDSTRLQQVVWNLLSNAVKFTPERGQVTVKLEKVIGNSSSVINEIPENPSIPHYAQITVSDTGKGISGDFLPYVFDYFRQADSATTRKFGGLGLGLAIVRHLVELHGGTIQAESYGEGRGATFTIKLPLMPSQSTVAQADQSFKPSLDLKGIKVLIVDDNTDTRDYVAFLLKQTGANVITAASAGEAFIALTQSPPDVLLSDIGMPEMDGYMLIRQVRTLPPEQGGQIPAIALSAYAGDFDQKQALQAGFQQHIAKPINPQTLIEAIANLTHK